MIYVDELQPCRPPWTGKMSCHLVSDESEEELLSFAATIGLPDAWCQRRAALSHFDLSPMWRARAVKGYAVEVSCKELARITLAFKRSRLGPGSAAHGHR